MHAAKATPEARTARLFVVGIIALLHPLHTPTPARLYLIMGGANCTQYLLKRYGVPGDCQAL
jgi:hypothetical protein